MLLTKFVLQSYSYSVNQVGTKTFRGPLALALLLAVFPAGSADATNYTFYGREGFGQTNGLNLSGLLTLDLSDPGVVGPLANGEGSFAQYLSANHLLTGSFGAWSFGGVPTVSVADGPEFWSGGAENLAPDYWIVRTPVTGPSVNGWTPAYFNIFFYTSAAGMTSSQLAPPMEPLTSVNPTDLSFYLELSDGSENPLVYSGEVSVLAVPEPTVFGLICLGGGLLLAGRFRNGLQRH